MKNRASQLGRIPGLRNRLSYCSLNGCEEYYVGLKIFKMNAVCHLEFLFFLISIFNLTGCRLLQSTSYVILQSFIALRRYSNLKFFKMAAVYHLGFLDSQIFNFC